MYERHDEFNNPVDLSWIDRYGLGKYHKTLHDLGIDHLADFDVITKEDLVETGLSPVDADALISKVANIKKSQPSKTGDNFSVPMIPNAIGVSSED